MKGDEVSIGLVKVGVGWGVNLSVFGLVCEGEVGGSVFVGFV